MINIHLSTNLAVRRHTTRPLQRHFFSNDTCGNVTTEIAKFKAKMLAFEFEA